MNMVITFIKAWNKILVISRKGCIGFTISCGSERLLFTGKGADDRNGKAEFMGIPYPWKVTFEKGIDRYGQNEQIVKY